MLAKAVWISSERLKLRPLGAADAAAVLEGLNDPFIATWLATTPFPYPADALHYYLARAPEGETFAIHDGEGFAGLIGAGEELGFWIARRAQGRGYAKEAATTLLRAVFEFYPGPMRAGYFAGNHASARVLASLGFVPSGRGKRANLALGIELDHIDLTLSRSDFHALHGGLPPLA